MQQDPDAPIITGVWRYDLIRPRMERPLGEWCSAAAMAEWLMCSRRVTPLRASMPSPSVRVTCQDSLMILLSIIVL